ncbi:Fe-S protein assembly chaperone HscA [Rickettsiales bacterium]|nr:Fe-S protein assembly chaperone HscA [Rickettsiales bacterium]
MTLLQICEPGQTPEPHSQKDEIAVGIDLGTTNSLISVKKDDKIEIIADKNGNRLHPSIVSYVKGQAITGHRAKGQDKAIHSIKRLMGRGVDDIKPISGQYPYEIIENKDNKLIKLNIDGQAKTPIDISAEILKSLKNIASDALQIEVTKAVITVPAYFDDSARNATKDAAKLAGLEVLRLVNEPTAAALAYGLDKKAEGIYAVYDLGGGTFDISILKMTKGVFQVLATGGTTQIGGDDFDKELVELLLWEYKNQKNKSVNLDQEVLADLIAQARIVKEKLSQLDQLKWDVNIEGDDFSFDVKLEDFQRAILPYVNATIDLCKQAVSDADINLDDVQGVVLVGGSSRVPLIKAEVEEFFKQKPLDDVNPDEVVCCGAAIQADGLINGGNHLLLDVIPLSLGLETMGGLMEKVITRNTPIPVARAQEFTTHKDGQTAMKIKVAQGEREMASQNRILAEFDIKGIPPMPAGAARVKVTFNVDADGLLTVSAQEETSGVQQIVEVRPEYGLKSGDIENMLRSSMVHAKEDMQERLLSEAKIEAQAVLNAIEKAIEVDSVLLNGNEGDDIDHKIKDLKDALDGTDRAKVQSEMDLLEKTASAFIERRMNKHIGDSLRGQKV